MKVAELLVKIKKRDIWGVAEPPNRSTREKKHGQDQNHPAHVTSTL